MKIWHKPKFRMPSQALKYKEMFLPFGKYKNTRVCRMVSKDQIEYLKWLVKNVNLKKSLRKAVDFRINQYDENILKIKKLNKKPQVNKQP